MFWRVDGTVFAFEKEQYVLCIFALIMSIPAMQKLLNCCHEEATVQSVWTAEPQVDVSTIKLYSAATEKQQCVLSGLLSHRSLSALLNSIVLPRKGSGAFWLDCCQHY